MAYSTRMMCVRMQCNVCSVVGSTTCQKTKPKTSGFLAIKWNIEERDWGR